MSDTRPFAVMLAQRGVMVVPSEYLRPGNTVLARHDTREEADQHVWAIEQLIKRAVNDVHDQTRPFG